MPRKISKVSPLSGELRRIAKHTPPWRLEDRRKGSGRMTLVWSTDFYRRMILPREAKRRERIRDYRLEASLSEASNDTRLRFSFAYPSKPFGGTDQYYSQRLFVYDHLKAALKTLWLRIPDSPKLKYWTGKHVTYPGLKGTWVQMSFFDERCIDSFSSPQAMIDTLSQFAYGVNRYFDREHQGHRADGRQYVWGTY